MPLRYQFPTFCRSRRLKLYAFGHRLLYSVCAHESPICSRQNVQFHEISQWASMEFRSTLKSNLWKYKIVVMNFINYTYAFPDTLCQTHYWRKEIILSDEFAENCIVTKFSHLVHRQKQVTLQDQAKATYYENNGYLGYCVVLIIL